MAPPSTSDLASKISNLTEVIREGSRIQNECMKDLTRSIDDHARTMEKMIKSNKKDRRMERKRMRRQSENSESGHRVDLPESPMSPERRRSRDSHRPPSTSPPPRDPRQVYKLRPGQIPLRVPLPQIERERPVHIPCLFCKGPHRSERCTDYHTLNSRKYYLSQYNLCWSCGNGQPKCQGVCQFIDTKCKICMETHWEVLCPDSEQMEFKPFDDNKPGPSNAGY